ncbi:MAG: four helix bundle protein [Candidatus Omnitrophica bacterium]|nr:four helix bundle protein [Candidatus Omnitrophota bacterium]
MKGYKKLKVWQKADDLACKVYLKTKEFPRDEIYGVTSQLRRAALSIPTNIVEGMGRQGKNELRNFVNIALGSLAETEYLLDFCNRLNYINEKSYIELEDLRKETGALLWNFYKTL